MDNIPEGRKKRVTGVGKGVHKKGQGRLNAGAKKKVDA